MLDSRRIMANNLQSLMDTTGKSRKDVCNGIGVSYTTFTDWVKGNSYPRPDKVEKLAAYFGCTPSDLMNDNLPEIKANCQSVKQPAPQQSHDINNNTGTVNTGIINGNVHNNGIITTVSPVPIPDICKMCQSLSPKARAQIDSLVNMLHEMEHGK